MERTQTQCHYHHTQCRRRRRRRRRRRYRPYQRWILNFGDMIPVPCLSILRRR